MDICDLLPAVQVVKRFVLIYPNNFCVQENYSLLQPESIFGEQRPGRF